MTGTLLNPWRFGNNHKQTRSPDNVHRLVYYDLNEVAMCGPLGGSCYLESNDKRKFDLGWCGGPPVWETAGQLVAVPIWTPERRQRLGVLNVITKELTVFQESFGLLHLRSFENNLIDINQSKPFDIQKEPVASVTKLEE
jgi:hypothetical protein